MNDYGSFQYHTYKETSDSSDYVGGCSGGLITIVVIGIFLLILYIIVCLLEK